MMTPQKLSRRYRSSYWVAKLINGLGLLCRLIGFVVAATLSYGGFAGARYHDQYKPAVIWVRDNMNLSIQNQRGIVVGCALVAAALILFLCWLVGTFVSAVGQMLKAVLDTAVNTSPFLSPEEKQNVIC